MGLCRQRTQNFGGRFHSVCCLRTILIKMLHILIWTLTVLCSFRLADVHMGRHMFPLTPVIERGSTLQRFCLCEHLSLSPNASDIIWTLDGDRIAKENYIIVNDSVSGVVIRNFTKEQAFLACSVNISGHMQRLDRAEIKSGFPPQRPENISCIDYMDGNITCSWTFERDTYIETYYTIIGETGTFKTNNAASDQHGYPSESMNNSYSRKDREIFLNTTWKSKDGSRSYNYRDDIFHPTFCIQLKLENPLGKAESQCVHQNSNEILKIQPPPVNIEKMPGMKKMLRVSWERGSFSKECRIRYRNMKQNDSKGNLSEIFGQNNINLTNLRSFTEYAVAIQCIASGSRHWSDWSREYIGTTEEEAPSKEVDLWRVLGKCQPNGSRSVHLFWKRLKEDESLGVIKGYRIKCFTQRNHSLAWTENTTDELFTAPLMGQAYVMSVIAYNAAGDSPEAVLRIPSCAEESKDHPRVVTLNTSVLNEQMIVEWKTSDSDIHSYVVEWYDVLDMHKRSWEYVRNTTKLIFQKGAFEPHRRYNISVYPVYKDEIKAPSSIRTYFKQGRPSYGPVANVENVDKTEATITWKEIEQGKTNGDIMNYTIFYSVEGGEEIGKTVNASVLQYRLKSLQASVKYSAHVMASTIAGGTNGTSINFTTHQLSLAEIVVTYISVGLLILCLVTFGLLWALKRRMLKKIFWPKIPQPKLPEMSQDNLEKPLKEPQSEDNTVIPEVLSVLKVDDNDECQLLKLEDCLGQTEVPTEDAIYQHEASGSGEHEAIKRLLQTAPSLGQHFRSQLLPTPMIQQPPLQKSEESFSEEYQNSNCYDEEKQDQTDMEEKTEFNPYLRNSVHRREFLLCENLSAPKKKERKKQAVPVLPCESNSNGQQYVALDAIVLTEHQ